MTCTSWSDGVSSELRPGQGELFLRISPRRILAQIHSGQRSLRGETTSFGPVHRSGIPVGNVPEDPFTPALREERFDQTQAGLGRPGHDGAQIKSARTVAQQTIALDSVWPRLQNQ